MTKSFFCLSVLGLLVLSSCKKEFTCNCIMETELIITNANGVSTAYPDTHTSTLSVRIKDTEKNAKEKCKVSNGTVENTYSAIEETSITEIVTTNCKLN